ncbi:hypothetical protein, partial [Mycolicibacterium insubricum]|uniref:hypothetical protein n=1 Tax=Mycolicibacterium insubricum TaxID=444597 RepID=UPI0021F3C573
MRRRCLSLLITLATVAATLGAGTATRHGDKVINIDPGLAAEGPTHRVNALAHELGHALYQPEVDRR